MRAWAAARHTQTQWCSAGCGRHIITCVSWAQVLGALDAQRSRRSGGRAKRGCAPKADLGVWTRGSGIRVRYESSECDLCIVLVIAVVNSAATLPHPHARNLIESRHVPPSRRPMTHDPTHAQGSTRSPLLHSHRTRLPKAARLVRHVRCYLMRVHTAELHLNPDPNAS